jgi:mRNA-degrading endonuclease RelE of RelBE toxin-antitoxin system
MAIKLNQDSVVFTKKFEKLLRKLPALDQEMIGQSFQQIFGGAEKYNIRKLKNYPHAGYRLKIRHYRLLFNYDKILQKCIFVGVFDRKNLY